jgi:hypothetical protein
LAKLVEVLNVLMVYPFDRLPKPVPSWNARSDGSATIGSSLPWGTSLIASRLETI